MAFAATLGVWVEELVAAITSISAESDPERLNVLTESCLRDIRHHNFLRTNQFDVDSHLNGLEERFRVLNRDGLADALRERLDALSNVSNRFTPDVLHFLLELSDQPTQKSKLADLQLLHEPPPDSGPSLKWEDIAQEDDWSEDGDLWKRPDFADDSADEVFVDDRSDASGKSDSTDLSSTGEYRRRPSDLIVKSRDDDALTNVRDSQLWRDTEPSRDPDGKSCKVVISELHAVREVLFMLLGLENDLFNKQGQPLMRYQLQHASWEVYRALLGAFGEVGRHLHILRNFAAKSQQLPLMQIFRGAVEKRLRIFDAQISTIESRFVDVKDDTVVSLVKLLDEINPDVRPLLVLAEIIQQLEREKYPHPFRYLELVFESAEVAQLDGSESTYRFLGTLFFQCFQIYLRPIRRWMEDGELFEGDKTFFVSDTKAHLPLSQVWHSQFKLRKTTDGNLHAPKFLQPATAKIFMTGKSVVILKHLGKNDNSGAVIPEPALNFETLRTTEFADFAPFSEVFAGAFEQWMMSKHHAASATLRQVLFDSYDLLGVLDNLQRVYLMSDGSQSDIFSFTLFNNLDLLNPNWHDRFTLTELAHEAFAYLADSHCISVSASTGDVGLDMNASRRSVQICLPAIKMTYRMSWPLQIVLSEDSMVQYQAIFAFLLQLRRATYLLQKHRVVSDGMYNFASKQASYYKLRSKLLWFCGALRSYLSNLVLQPLTKQLREDLRRSGDIDAMIAAHSEFAKRMVDEACLSSKLEPIRQCILDILDLAIRLEDAHLLEVEQDADETQALSRLSLMSPSAKSSRSGRYMKPSEEEDESFLSEQCGNIGIDADKTYSETLGEIQTDLERHLRFICSGLRGVARASGNTASSKWDTLAEILEAGVQDQRW